MKNGGAHRLRRAEQEREDRQPRGAAQATNVPTTLEARSAPRRDRDLPSLLSDPQPRAASNRGPFPGGGRLRRPEPQQASQESANPCPAGRTPRSNRVQGRGSRGRAQGRQVHRSPERARWTLQKRLSSLSTSPYKQGLMCHMIHHEVDAPHRVEADPFPSYRLQSAVRASHASICRRCLAPMPSSGTLACSREQWPCWSGSGRLRLLARRGQVEPAQRAQGGVFEQVRVDAGLV